MIRSKKLVSGEKVLIIWTKKDDFVQLDGSFKSYVPGVLTDETPLFSTKSGIITGEECFWVSKKHITKKTDIFALQNLLAPLQVKMNLIADSLGKKPVEKIKSDWIKKMSEQGKQKLNHLKFFIKKHGFDPTDDTWIEEHLAKDNKEKQWFKFMREQNSLNCNRETFGSFDKSHNGLLTFEEAKKLTTKKTRYILGTFAIRYKGEKSVDLWIKKAKEFESRFYKREQRKENWTLSRNGKFPLVSTLKPIKFWAGAHLVQCIEKIPHVFVSPDCEYIKKGIVLEVRSYDPVEKWIDLDFAPEIREQLIGRKEVDEEATYAIALHPKNLEESLEGLDQLKEDMA